MTPTTVVFDIGGVLVDWKPELAWAHAMGSEEAARAFMARVDFSEKNLRADGGMTFDELSEEIDERSVSKSSVSRRYVAMTTKQMTT